MSSKPRSRSANPEHAAVFAALGDPTRLLLVTTLADGGARSISQLTAGHKMSRQAVTKHLRVLESAGVVRCRRTGRESHFEFDPDPVVHAKEYLEFVSQQWDQALSRLKAFVED